MPAVRSQEAGAFFLKCWNRMALQGSYICKPWIKGLNFMCELSVRPFAGRIFFVLALCVFLCGNAYARSDKGGTIREAAGITAEDIEAASVKEELSLFDLYALAVENTERLAIEEEFKKQAEAGYDRARGAWFPRISIRGSTGSRETTAGDREISTEVNLYARQNIITGLDELSGIRGGAASVRQQHLRLRQATREYLYDIAYLYFRVVSIEKRLDNRRTILSHYRTLSGELERRVGLGRTRRSELLRANSRISRLEAEIIALEKELSGARLSLFSLSGVDKDTVLIYPREISQPENFISEKTSYYVERRYDILALKEGVSVADAGLLAARGGRLPNVYLEGSYPLYDSGPGSRGYYAGIGAEFPLFSGGMVSARIREKESVLRQAELRLSEKRRHAAVEIMEAEEAYLKGAASVDSFKKSLDAIEENYRLILNDYRHNLVSLIDLIDALTLLEEARDDYERSVLEKRLARIRLAVASGELAEEGIGLLRD